MFAWGHHQEACRLAHRGSTPMERHGCGGGARGNARSVRARAGFRWQGTTEDTEGTEGCLRSWVVRVASGSAHSWFEFAFRVLSS